MSGLRGRGPAFATPDTRTTSAPAPKLVESLALRKLSAMLQNTLRKWPKARLLKRPEGFGVSLAADTYLYVSASGNLTAEEKRDLLALFATWWVADPSGLTRVRGRQDG